MKKRSINKKYDKRLIFYVLMLAYPVLQFCIFYIGVNFNSLLLSFKEIDMASGTFSWTLKNFPAAFEKLTSATSELAGTAWMSLKSALIVVSLSTVLALLFSFYIYKKMFASELFRVMLFLPSVISSLVLVTIFQFFVERAVPAIYLEMCGKTMRGLIENPSTRYATIMFFNVWAGFGPTMLMYSNAMAGISPEIVDSAKVDGATGLKEFFCITLPSVYPTITTFVVVGVAGIFTNQFHLYSFYRGGAPDELWNLGYYLYAETQKVTAANSTAEYPLLSAIGLLITVVVIPLTFIVKWLMEKFGPSDE